jgi:murein DD-endopeptidase MepM/ murein hydrolase activator NlpD
MSAPLRGAVLAAALLVAGWNAGLSAQTTQSDAVIRLAQGGRLGGMQGGGMYGGMHGGGMAGGGHGGFKGPQQAGRSDFPHGCHAVCSGFHSRKRCDGSIRSPKFPVHRGVDVAVPVGTPLLAIADGTVVGSRRGPSIGGIGLVIRHPPEATGLSSYTYSFYKHLDAISPLPKGTAVHKGQQVGKSGKSGTEGSIHFGNEGFAELHFEIWDKAGAKWPSGHLTDPVAFLRRTASRTGWFCR